MSYLESETTLEIEKPMKQSNPVHIQLEHPPNIDSIVLACRQNGDLIELAERTPPATGTITGAKPTNTD